MDIPADLLPNAYLWAAVFPCLLLLLAALWTAPWHKIRDNEAQHVYLGALVSLCVVWAMQGGIQPGLGFHLLGMTLLVLMFEWQFALLGAGILVAISTAVGPAGWSAYALNLLLMGALPILFTRISLYACQRRLPHNYFIYVLVNAFFVGALSILLAGAASAWVQDLSGVHPGSTLFRNFVQILPLLMFGEGFINGGAMALLVAYRPHWVATFHDGWYLRDQ